MPLSDTLPWLQTPRLKRLAEIVSAQAMAQQEKMNGLDDAEHDDLSEKDEDYPEHGDGLQPPAEFHAGGVTNGVAA